MHRFTVGDVAVPFAVGSAHDGRGPPEGVAGSAAVGRRATQVEVQGGDLTIGRNGRLVAVHRAAGESVHVNMEFLVDSFVIKT